MSATIKSKFFRELFTYIRSFGWQFVLRREFWRKNIIQTDWKTSVDLFIDLRRSNRNFYQTKIAVIFLSLGFFAAGSILSANRKSNDFENRIKKIYDEGRIKVGRSRRN